MVKFVKKFKDGKAKKKVRLQIATEIEDDGEAEILVIEKNGDLWRVAQITMEGRLRLFTDVSDTTGLDLDDENRIKLEE